MITRITPPTLSEKQQKLRVQSYVVPVIELSQIISEEEAREQKLYDDWIKLQNKLEAEIQTNREYADKAAYDLAVYNYNIEKEKYDAEVKVQQESYNVALSKYNADLANYNAQVAAYQASPEGQKVAELKKSIAETEAYIQRAQSRTGEFAPVMAPARDPAYFAYKDQYEHSLNSAIAQAKGRIISLTSQLSYVDKVPEIQYYADVYNSAP